MNEKPTILKVAEGLLILSGYGEAEVCAEHEIIYAGPFNDAANISAKDQMKLEELGWHIDEDSESWAHFV
jgi:hypothetical protein